MKKILSVIAIALASVIGCQAQMIEVQRVEGGVFGGMTVPLDNFHDYNNLVNYGFGLEVRYNIPRSSFDCGVMFDFTTSLHHYHHPDFTNTFSDSKDTWGILAVGDYNFRQGKKINPFAGLGVGVGFGSSHGEIMIDSKGSAALFVPRIGVELFHHIRLTASCHLMRKGFNTFDLSVGFVLGGRPR